MEGNSSDITWGTPDDRLWAVRLKASFMSIECILAMFGNIVVMLFTTTRNTFPRNASVYIFAMAVADFVKGVGYASHVGPFLDQDMAGSEAWCKGWGYVQSALRFSSIHLVTCVSVDRPGCSAWPDDEIQEAPLDDPPADKGSTEETRDVTETGNDPMDPARPGPLQTEAAARPGCCRCRRVGSKSLIAMVVVAFGLQVLMHAVKIYDAAVKPLDDDVYFALVWLSNCHAFANAILYSVVHRTFHLAVVMDSVALLRFLLRCCGARVEPEDQPPTSI
ncbi:PREDICTED: uncharacterized protein LOC109470031 [Branchiostoma belcheri]|uniref:Uncharacterized protein LOC109470031 n=1 Tax=Branchiostoma belcheri TaxID=7741 RepID=A0A6P4Z459_BRABE|nr:PREDICTED: uncharacterized protein LOC109470031 [Branchiostoma belcheri]